MHCFEKILLTVAVGACAAAARADEPADWVDPFVGTTATGHTFPGACVPFGLVQASPDSGNCNWEYCSGYRHDDKSVYGADGKPFIPKGASTIFVGGGQPGFARTLSVEPKFVQ